MKKRILQYWTIILLTSCSTHSSEQDVSSVEVCLSEYSYSTTHIDKISHILSTGDTEMYLSIYTRFRDDGAGDAILPISIVMANKYNHKTACYHVYQILTSLYRNYYLYDDNIDSITFQIANDYLERSNIETEKQ